MKIEEIVKKHLKKIVKENEGGNYMFFSNLEQIKRQCELLLQLDESKVNELLNNGHDWADDHISTAKENMDQVFDFMMNEFKGDHDNNEGDINEVKMKGEDPCWKGYEMVGKKMKNGKEVPNCVPKK
jgi:tRNA(Ile)-lysidine synthase TilS/MesJ